MQASNAIHEVHLRCGEGTVLSMGSHNHKHADHGHDDGHDSGHRQGRMAHDGSFIKEALVYGRHIFEFWVSDLNQTVVDVIDPQPGETVLDVGAGMGAAIFVAAARPDLDIKAVEPSAFMRANLKLRLLFRRGRSKITLINGTAEQLPLGADSVDAAWAVNVAHHMGDVSGAATELARVLKPGGRLLIVDEDFSDPSHPNHEEMTRSHARHHHAGGHDDETQEDVMVDFDGLASALTGAGFSSVEVTIGVLADVPTRQARANR